MTKRPKLEVNTVYILEEVIPFDGTTIQGVYVDLEVAKARRPGVWRLDVHGDWHTQEHDDTKTFYVITTHNVLT